MARFEKIVLIVAAVIFLFVGIQGIIDPQKLLAPLAISLESTDAFNEMRAVYGGLHLGISGLLFWMAIKNSHMGIIILTVIITGLCLGRILSLIVDGRPNTALAWRFTYTEGAGALALNIILGHKKIRAFVNR
ncbi:hypothetical protein COV82_00365 [Candidatus Peregrinibacteria bacterium CG11_big_fil_rev_8_21_14_0_20_46_8]|nr:MAG: hypothetical protein COV82_00365 [Candidatus Peregrinibacteria bacterium CG11_big_fil_rev_8_21_14_0_20_46_8]